MKIIKKLQDFKNICIIISTASKNYKIVENKIRQKLDKILDGNYSLLLSNSENFIINESRKFALNNKNALIMAVGGDGSLSEVVNGIIDTDAIFTFLPNGTGNDFSRTIYPNENLDDILNKIENMEIRKIDLIKVNNEYSLNAFSFGFESQVLEKSIQLKEKLGRFKKFSIILALFSILYKLKPNKYKFEYMLSNGEKYIGETTRYATAITNGKFFGTGFMPSPHAIIDDGILNLNSIRVDNIFKLLHYLTKYKSEEHLKYTNIGENLELTSGKIKSLSGNIISNIDGNIRHYDVIDFEVLKQKLNFAQFID